MKVNRESFLQILESVTAGLSNTGVEQGKCFIFQDSQVMTFSGECFVRRKIPIELSGAVEADPILQILSKLKDEEIDVKTEEGQLLIQVFSLNKTGKEILKKKSWLQINPLITVPTSLVEDPGDWQKLHEDFGEAVSTVSQCSSKTKDEREWMLTCIHLHPKWIESGDCYQFCRYRIQFGLESSILVKAKSLQGVSQLGMTEFSQTGSWLHFRNPSGVVYSCRLHVGEYPSMGQLFKFEGESVVLPKDLSEGIDRSEIFSKMEDQNLVQIDLKPNKVWITGKSEKGGHTESKKVKYEGPEMSFCIAPKMLSTLAKKFSEGIVAEDKLKFDSGTYKLLCYLRKGN